jgi:hypothetical protein
MHIDYELDSQINWKLILIPLGATNQTKVQIMYLQIKYKDTQFLHMTLLKDLQNFCLSQNMKQGN